MITLVQYCVLINGRKRNFPENYLWRAIITSNDTAMVPALSEIYRTG